MPRMDSIWNVTIHLKYIFAPFQDLFNLIKISFRDLDSLSFFIIFMGEESMKMFHIFLMKYFSSFLCVIFLFFISGGFVRLQRRDGNIILNFCYFILTSGRSFAFFSGVLVQDFCRCWKDLSKDINFKNHTPVGIEHFMLLAPSQLIQLTHVLFLHFSDKMWDFYLFVWCFLLFGSLKNSCQAMPGEWRRETEKRRKHKNIITPIKILEVLARNGEEKLFVSIFQVNFQNVKL